MTDRTTDKTADSATGSTTTDTTTETTAGATGNGSAGTAGGAAGKVKGPAAYFPAIEKKYGRPIAEWKELIRAALPAKHMELVGRLKNEHGMGHGHANALVAHTLAESGDR